MIDERKIKIIAKYFSYDYWDNHKKTLEKMIRSTYIEGFKEGVQRAIETCSRCEGIDENKKHIADVCKFCKRNKAVSGDD